MRRNTLLASIALVAAIVMLAAACRGDHDTSAAPAGTTAQAAVPSGPVIRLRGQDFRESITTAEVYGQYLRAKGYDVTILPPSGYRAGALDGLKNKDLDLIVDYIAGDQAALAPDDPPSHDPAEVAATIGPLLAKQGSTVLPYSPAGQADALVVRADSPAATISGVKGLGYVLGASRTCFTRPDCYLGLTDPATYGITFAGRRILEFGPLLGAALKARQVDAVVWSTTAPQIPASRFRILRDDRGLFPAGNIAPIVRTEVLEAYGDRLTADLDALSARITTNDLVAWNRATDIDGETSAEVARDWLAQKGLD